MQHYQWVCITLEGGTQTVPCQSAHSLAQGEVPGAVPCTAGLLCGTVLGKGPHPHRACNSGTAQVLAQDLQPERGTFSHQSLLMVSPFLSCTYFNLCKCAGDVPWRN